VSVTLPGAVRRGSAHGQKRHTALLEQRQQLYILPGCMNQIGKGLPAKQPSLSTPANSLSHNRRPPHCLLKIFPTLILGFLYRPDRAALAPGPTLVATINASLTGNWATGLKITLGHVIIETAIFFLIILGLASIASPYTTAIAVVGASPSSSSGPDPCRQQDGKSEYNTVRVRPRARTWPGF